MAPDPKWADVLVTNEVLGVAAALACGALLIVNALGWLPAAPWWVLWGCWGGFFFFLTPFLLNLLFSYLEHWVQLRAERKHRR